MSKNSEFISERYIASWKKYDCEAVASLAAKREELDSHETQLLSELEFIRDEKKRTIHLIAALEGKESTDNFAYSELPEQLGKNSDSNEHDPNEDVKCGRATVADIADCPSQRQAMYVIAEKNDGTLKLNRAAELVMAAGMSKSNVRTVSASLHNYLSNNDDFDWIGPSEFRLKSAEEIELTTGEEMALEAQKNKKEGKLPTVSQVSKDAA